MKFSAEKTNYPKTVNMYVDLEYLEKTTATFNILDTKANVYQYIGYVARGGKYQMREALVLEQLILHIIHMMET